MSKYPCGICSIGVRHKGILCTGICNQWFHSKCLNWTDKKLKALTRIEIEKWNCASCNGHAEVKTSKMDEMEQKILKLGDMETTDLETSLSLASEIGSALLTENQELKQKLTTATNENIRLENEIKEWKKSNDYAMVYQLQLEESKTENENMLLKHNHLIENIDDLEKALANEKQIRLGLEKMFEDHDKENTETIHRHELTIKHLQNKIKDTERNTHNTVKDTERETHKHAETQTTNTDSPTITTNTLIYTELMHLKTKITVLEENMGKLDIKKPRREYREHKKPQRKPKNNCRHAHKEPLKTEGNRQTLTKKLDTHFTEGNRQTPPKKLDTQLTEGNRQTQPKKLDTQFTEGIRQTPPKKLDIQLTEGIRQTPPKKLMKRTTTNMQDRDETALALPLSDDEDAEVTETRTHAGKVIRTRSVNSNTGRMSTIREEDQQNIKKQKIFAFPPEDTPLVTTQLTTDEDLQQTCRIHLINMDLTAPPKLPTLPPQAKSTVLKRIKDRNLSFNNFITARDSQDSTHIAICFNEKHGNWKRKLFRFLELANDCIKFPVLFSIRLEEFLETANLSKLHIRELTQVFLQYACNAYLHRFRVYTKSKDHKQIIDDLLDYTTDKAQRKIAKLSPSRTNTYYSTWRTTRGTHTGATIYQPTLLSDNSKENFAQAAMQEQRELWKTKETLLLRHLNTIYREYNISHLQQDNYKLQDFCNKTKNKYAIINLNSGEFLTEQETVNPTPYQFAFDGARLVQIQKNKNGKYATAPNNIAINQNVLVSDETLLLNELRLYNNTKHINTQNIHNTKLNLVQGVPGCGKTTFLLNNYKAGDLVLFPTRDAAIDFRQRFKNSQTGHSQAKCNDTFRTVHSFLINSTQHLKRGNTYKRLFIDEALMMHAGEILFASILSGAKEVMLIGDTNQIPYINRAENLDVKYHSITEIATTTKILNTTYRCTKSTTAILSKFYTQGMQTTNQTENELEIQHFNGLESLNLTLDKNKYKCLVFKQAEKRELNKLGFKASTIHEFQGRQAEHIAVIRTSTRQENIYESQHHCVVAISRHTNSFLYITPKNNDKLGQWIQQVNSLSPQELSKYYNSPEKPTGQPTPNPNTIPEKDNNQSSTQTPQNTPISHHNFLEQHPQPRERHKEHFNHATKQY